MSAERFRDWVISSMHDVELVTKADVEEFVESEIQEAVKVLYDELASYEQHIRSEIAAIERSAETLVETILEYLDKIMTIGETK